MGSIRGEVKVATQNLVCGLIIDTFNIIITPFDLFGEGRYCYTFHARCDENPSLVLEDGATRIFLNTRGTNRNEVSEELIQFLEYMEQSTLDVDIPDTNGNLIKIHNHVRQVKASEEIGVKFMQRWEEEAMWKREGRETGLAERLNKGQTINQISIIRFQLLSKQMTPVQISDILGLSLAFVQQICDLLTTHPQEPDEKLADYFLSKNKALNCADMSHIYGHTQLRAFIRSTNLYTQSFPRRWCNAPFLARSSL